MAWEDYVEGQQFSWPFSFSSEQMTAFINLSGDNSPIHVSGDYAASAGFDGPLLHGALLATLLSKFIGTKLQDQYAMTTGFTINFLRPAYANIEYIFSAVLLNKFESFKMLEFNFRILNGVEILCKGTISAKWSNLTPSVI